MSVVPAAPFLTDFGIRPLVPEPEEEPRQALAVGGEIDWTGQVEEAYARGIEEGRQAAAADTIARLDEQKAASEHSLAAARQAWCEDQGPQIAELITTAIRDMEDRLALSAERVLRPFLAQAVRDQAISQLRSIIDELVVMNPGITLEISGPEDLLDAVRMSLAASVVTVSYVTNAACDVQIKAGASIIETRIAAWLQNNEGHAA